jgi:hypothetical protein
MNNEWLVAAIVAVERHHAAGLPTSAGWMQAAIDAAIEEGRVTERELLEAGRLAAAELGRAEKEKKTYTWPLTDEEAGEVLSLLTRPLTAAEEEAARVCTNHWRETWRRQGREDADRAQERSRKAREARELGFRPSLM